MDELIADFLADTGASIAQIEADLAVLGEDGPLSQAPLRIVRVLHTIKGTSSFLKLPRVRALAHACEGALLRWRDGRGVVETPALARTALAQIKDILAALATDGAEPAGDDAPLLAALSDAHAAIDWAAELASIRDNLLARASAVLSPLQRLDNAVAASEPPAQQVAISGAWKALPPLVADLSAELGKPLKLILDGGDVEIASAALAPLREALVHLVRNSADHGIEAPSERRSRRKAKSGVIALSAVREDGATILRVSDDGRGLDAASIRHRAISLGMVFASHAARMDCDQIHAFIFAPGFSTAETQTFVSGRGVGLDAARAAIEALGGRIQVQSQWGRGTVFTLTIPAAPMRGAQEPSAEVAPIARSA